MPELPNEVEDLSPYKLLRSFSKNRVLPCIFLALLIHVAVIGGLSAEYIYYTWIDPAAGPQQGTAAKDNGQPEGVDPGVPGQPEEESPQADPAGETAGNAGSPDVAEKGTPMAGEDAPVVGRVTDKEDPAKIPKEPAGLGLLDEIDD